MNQATVPYRFNEICPKLMFFFSYTRCRTSDRVGHKQWATVSPQRQVGYNTAWLTRTGRVYYFEDHDGRPRTPASMDTAHSTIGTFCR